MGISLVQPPPTCVNRQENHFFLRFTASSISLDPPHSSTSSFAGLFVDGEVSSVTTCQTFKNISYLSNYVP